jgi:hypothetical protein
LAGAVGDAEDVDVRGVEAIRLLHWYLVAKTGGEKSRLE